MTGLPVFISTFIFFKEKNITPTLAIVLDWFTSWSPVGWGWEIDEYLSEDFDLCFQIGLVKLEIVDNHSGITWDVWIGFFLCRHIFLSTDEEGWEARIHLVMDMQGNLFLAWVSIGKYLRHFQLHLQTCELFCRGCVWVNWNWSLN